jgi:hypothetical protein
MESNQPQNFGVECCWELNYGTPATKRDKDTKYRRLLCLNK